jgi:hypothetical protein
MFPCPNIFIVRDVSAYTMESVEEYAIRVSTPEGERGMLSAGTPVSVSARSEAVP